MPLWSRRPSTVAVLQYTYNEAYENSLQSILKESNFEYEESLASWTSTLQGITNGLATLDNSPLRTAQEMSLMTSIRDIERQCNERIEFLRTKLYNPDMATNPYRSGGGYAASSSGSIQGARSVPRVAVGSKTKSEDSVRGATRQAPSAPANAHQKSASEGNFHPMPSVSDMPYGMYRAKQSAITKTLNQLQINSNDNANTRSSSNTSMASATSAGHTQSLNYSHSHSQQSAPQPAPQRTMLKTLRTGKSDRQKKASTLPASNAATAAWKNPATTNSRAVLQAAREKQERQQEIIMRTAQQAISARESQSRLKRSPQSDHLAQFNGFDSVFEGDRAGSESPELGPVGSVPAARASSPALSQPKPRPVNRYVVSTSHIANKRANPTRPSPPPSRNTASAPQPKAAPKSAPKPAAPKATPKEAALDSEDELDEWDIMAREKIKDLRGVDENAALQIISEIVLKGDPVHWDDIAGLDKAKASLKETVVYPFLRPDLFSGLREPALGMLLFGPPGTGKTMLARAVATESKSTFFSISASSLTSKYMGESEKLVRALFQMAKALAPSIIFVDEIDSILTQRADSGEHEASRRIKNEFLVQWSDLQAAAAGKNSSENVRRVLVLGATNLPWAIDEAARRRFVRRQYIPLPEAATRKQHLNKLLSHQKHALTPEDIDMLVEKTEGYSGSDVTALAKDAAMGPLRALGEALLTTDPDQIRSMNITDFEESMKTIKPSVSPEGLQAFEQWAALYGSSGA